MPALVSGPERKEKKRLHLSALFNGRPGDLRKPIALLGRLMAKPVVGRKILDMSNEPIRSQKKRCCYSAGQAAGGCLVLQRVTASMQPNLNVLLTVLGCDFRCGVGDGVVRLLLQALIVHSPQISSRHKPKALH